MKKLDPASAQQAVFDPYDVMPLAATYTQLTPNSVVELVPITTQHAGHAVRRARIVNKSTVASPVTISVAFQDAASAFSATGVFAQGIQILPASVLNINYRDNLRLTALATATCAISVTVETK